MIAQPATATFKALLVGVGGQGVLTAARILGEAAMAAGLNLRVGQVHGMSQRGGSVEATVVIGPGRTAIVGAHEADLLLGFEPLEARAAANRLKPGAVVVFNTATVAPPALARRGADYPELETIIGTLKEGRVLTVLNASALAEEAGSRRALGSVMLGAAGRLPVSDDALKMAIESFTPGRHREANLRAFELGRAAAGEGASR